MPSASAPCGQPFRHRRFITVASASRSKTTAGLRQLHMDRKRIYLAAVLWQNRSAWFACQRHDRQRAESSRYFSGVAYPNLKKGGEAIQRKSRPSAEPLEFCPVKACILILADSKPGTLPDTQLPSKILHFDIVLDLRGFTDSKLEMGPQRS